MYHIVNRVAETQKHQIWSLFSLAATMSRLLRNLQVASVSNVIHAVLVAFGFAKMDRLALDYYY